MAKKRAVRKKIYPRIRSNEYELSDIREFIKNEPAPPPSARLVPLAEQAGNLFEKSMETFTEIYEGHLKEPIEQARTALGDRFAKIDELFTPHLQDVADTVKEAAEDTRKAATELRENAEIYGKKVGRLVQATYEKIGRDNPDLMANLHRACDTLKDSLTRWRK